MKLTLAISDLHWGGPDHMLRSRDSLLNNAVKRIGQLTTGDDPATLQLVYNGDMVVGSGIWRKQEWEQFMPDAHWQTWGVAHLLHTFHASLPSGLKALRDLVIMGNHDRTGSGFCLASDLAIKLAIMGIPATYCGTETTVNLNGKEEPSYCLFEHGYGSSSYYPFSYSLIRNTERKILLYDDMNVRINRACFGHSHWLFIGYALSPWRVLDCTGGLQRNDRAVLGRGVRDLGAILYVHDGQELRVEAIRPDNDAVRLDLQDGLLEVTNRAEIAAVMGRVMAWLIETGMIQPDVIAKREE